ncbi:hypothetical protein NF699_07035 [Sphingomonadaceae bacterium OTU29LAMAA1]|nr:hypothetical protein NF699_07035 [Sphingomonadaceae bacterium OTU29LAMAA1]
MKPTSQRANESGLSPKRKLLVTPQLALLPLRPTAIIQSNGGKDQSFYFLDEDRLPIWCKADSQHRNVRSNEWISTQLAESLEIRTGGWQFVEYDGETYFGSPHVESASQRLDLFSFLRSTDRNTYGGASLNRGLYLGSVICFDLFINNDDRHLRNFILSTDQSFRRLCAIDFADADLTALTTDRFPIAGSNTVRLGRDVRAIHGSFIDGALGTLDRIEGLAPDAFHRIVDSVPGDWLDSILRDRLNDAWGSSGFQKRLASLRAILKNGTLV